MRSAAGEFGRVRQGVAGQERGFGHGAAHDRDGRASILDAMETGQDQGPFGGSAPVLLDVQQNGKTVDQ